MAQVALKMRGSLPAGNFHVEHWTRYLAHNALEPLLTEQQAAHRKDWGIGTAGIHTAEKAEVNLPLAGGLAPEQRLGVLGAPPPPRRLGCR